jgi:hypothetical protein
MTQQYFKHFAIVLDNEEKKVNKSLFQRLIASIKGKFQRRHPLEDRLQYLLENEDFEYEGIIHVGDQKSENKYFLMRDFENIVRLIQEFCDDECTCRGDRRHDGKDYEITIELPKRKKLRKVTVYDKVTILERWVKIGYDMYRKHSDPWTGEEYIIVDGDTYDIRRDRYGKEYLK